MTNPDKTKSRNSGYAANILRRAFSQWGAKFGLIWIFILTVIAVFSPFIANSHPWLLSEKGVWSSPLLIYLTAADITLVAIFVTTVILIIKKPPMSVFVSILLGALLFAGTISSIFISPPQLTTYEQYREKNLIDKYDWVIWAPIPYSAKDYFREQGDTGLEAPLKTNLAEQQRTHLFGTDENGADVLSRMIHASRIALGIGFVATGIALVIGVIIGGLMGFFSGKLDMLGMRLVEIFEAIPQLFLLLTFVAFFGSSLYIMMVIIGLTSWSGYARYIRAEFLKLRQQDFVLSAIACGLPLRSILFRHMLPNGIAPLLVGVSFGVASAILAEATLSFLGLGIVDDPSWGQMLNQAVQASTFNWWMAVFPGGAIFLTVFAYNLMGESLRDAIDPQINKDLNGTGGKE